jgi:hypothetical protein
VPFFIICRFHMCKVFQESWKSSFVRKKIVMTCEKREWKEKIKLQVKLDYLIIWRKFKRFANQGVQ